MEEGPYITLKVGDLEPRERPIDGGFATLLQHMEKSDDLLADFLKEIQRSPNKTKIIREALSQKSLDWSDLWNLRKKTDALAKIGHLVSFWDMLSEEQREAEAAEFAKLIVAD